MWAGAGGQGPGPGTESSPPQSPQSRLPLCSVSPRLATASCRLALHLGHVGENLALQARKKLSFHLLSLKEPSASSPTSKKELTDLGRELRLHLGTKTRSHSGRLTRKVEAATAGP